MSVSSIQNQTNRSFSGQLSGEKIAKPRESRQQGLAQMPDRLEERKAALPTLTRDNPPSLFKKFLFEPIFEVIKFFLRGVFTFIDFLRKTAFQEKPMDRKTFLNHLREAPRAKKVLLQFRRIYSREEQNRIYQTVGEAHTGRIFWKEMIWERGPQENIELGRTLVSQDPFLLQEYL